MRNAPQAQCLANLAEVLSFGVLFASLVFLPAVRVSAEQFGQLVTIESLLAEMLDRSSLARYPDPEYRGLQASSYDRDSRSPDDGDAWFANWDRSQFIRTETRDGREEHVLMEDEGPGVIVRFWATWHGHMGAKFSNGVLRVYLDGEGEPVIEAPIAEVLDGGLLAQPPLSQSVAAEAPYDRRGHNLYLPIPYAKSCKVTYSTDALIDRGGVEGESLYYHINYRRYASDVRVQSFDMERLAAARHAIARVESTLSAEEWEESKGKKLPAWSGVIAPGATQQVASLDGAGAIDRLRIKLASGNSPQSLRSTLIDIEFDDEQRVAVPLGDFFATGYQPHAYKTWFTRVSSEGRMDCAWVMPYERSARVSLRNIGEEPVHVAVAKVSARDWQWDERSMHFGSTWRQLTAVRTGVNVQKAEKGAFDVNYATLTGKGVYVGDSLTLFNTANKWWGEGDEKVYVDGESFPSHFGTGTEDYYGYAWCRPERFEAPFHSQPVGNGNLSPGYTVNNRFRPLDAIPFRQSLRFDMELFHWADTRINYAPTTFFYIRPGSMTAPNLDIESAHLPVAMDAEGVQGRK